MAHLFPHYSEQCQTCIHVISLASLDLSYRNANNGLLNFHFSRTKFKQINKTDWDSMNLKKLSREKFTRNSVIAQKVFSYCINGATKRSVCSLVALPRSCKTCIILTLIWSAQGTDQMFTVRLLRLSDIEICCEWHFAFCTLPGVTAINLLECTHLDTHLP